MENTNKAIAVNSVILYIRLGVVAITGIFSTRFALQALGVVDYGLYSVIGSIISFIAIINTIMVSTSHRYISVAIGKGDTDVANRQFNLCLALHIAIAILTALFIFPIGNWYIHNYLSYSGNIENAIMVYYFSISASIISFIGVPYNGLLTAKENFKVFCIPDIIAHILKLGVAYLITLYFENKLFIYSAFMALSVVFPVIVYLLYCGKHYKEIVRFRFIRNFKEYWELLRFSGWVGYGAIAYVGKSQGSALIVNAFFNTIMNTALGIANSIHSIILLFSQNIAQPIAPQITKSYASGDLARSSSLLVMSTKLTYFVMFFVSAPFFVNANWILQVWLGEVPAYAVLFTLLIIIDTLVDSLNSGIKHIIFANGNIALFQIIPSTLKLVSIVVAYILLRLGFPVYSIFIAFIFFSVMVFFANQFILHKVVGFDNSLLWRRSYLPSLYITILFIPIALVCNHIHPILGIVLSLFSLSLIMLFVGFSSSERKALFKTFIKE